ncbi:flagellin lysine-N-methylase [Candidatus Desantisbacteria bacterium]|nr:flagellin lysine-N-methylase [Candidatus Desantisbacteria bacterium]
MDSAHYLVPDYLLKFKCQMCGECCSRDWDIEFDKKSYYKLEEIAKNNKNFLYLLKKNVIHIDNKIKIKRHEAETEPEDNSSYEYMVNGDKQKAGCPFLTSEKLCMIQKEYGEEILSDVCKSYPRLISLTTEAWEPAILFSCRKAAFLLKKTESVNFYKDPPGYHLPKLSKCNCIIDGKNIEKQYYFQYEEMLIASMQLKKIGIEERILLIGILANKMRNDNYEEVRELLEKINRLVIEKLKLISSNIGYMLKLIKEVWIQRAKIEPLSKKFLIFMNKKYNLSIDIKDNFMQDHEIQKFQRMYSNYYNPYKKEIEHIFENYFINFIFSKEFYLHSYIDAYFKFVLFFTLIRYLAVARCSVLDKPLDENILLDVIVDIEFLIRHNKTYNLSILNQIKKSEYYNLPYIASMVKVPTLLSSDTESANLNICRASI